MIPDVQPIQVLMEDYIQKSANLSISERLEYLEEYRLLVSESVFQEKTERIQKAWESFRNVS